MPELEKDPLLSKEDAKSNYKLAADGTFVEGPDETTEGIAGRILEKMKQQREEEEKKAAGDEGEKKDGEEKKDEGDKKEEPVSKEEAAVDK